MKTTVTMQEITPEKTDFRGNTYKNELHPIERAAFDFCVKHSIDRKGWRELVNLVNRGHEMHLDWEAHKVKQGRITDAIAYRLQAALNEPE
jgi:hypothetical protein